MNAYRMYTPVRPVYQCRFYVSMRGLEQSVDIGRLHIANGSLTSSYCIFKICNLHQNRSLIALSLNIVKNGNFLASKCPDSAKKSSSHRV